MPIGDIFANYGWARHLSFNFKCLWPHFWQVCQASDHSSNCVSTSATVKWLDVFGATSGRIPAVCMVNKNRHFKPKADVFRTLTTCFLCLNLTRALAQHCHNMKLKNVEDLNIQQISSLHWRKCLFWQLGLLTVTTCRVRADNTWCWVSHSGFHQVIHTYRLCRVNKAIHYVIRLGGCQDTWREPMQISVESANSTDLFSASKICRFSLFCIIFGFWTDGWTKQAIWRCPFEGFGLNSSKPQQVDVVKMNVFISCSPKKWVNQSLTDIRIRPEDYVFHGRR